jgi:hypothetical protein
MGSDLLNESNLLEQIDQAVISLRRGRQKLTISKISGRSGVPRRTIYNRPELKERCDLAIHAQKQELAANDEIAAATDDVVVKPIYGSKLIEQRYTKAREELCKQQTINSKLLENNRRLVIEKNELKGTIDRLTTEVEMLRKQLKANHIKSIK